MTGSRWSTIRRAAQSPGITAGLVVVALLAPLRVAAQEPVSYGTAVLNATILSFESGEPIEGAQISVEGVGHTSTDAEGRARLVDIAPGERWIRVAAPGHRSERLAVGFAADSTVELELELLMLIDLDPIVVRVRASERRLRLRGFYDRQTSFPFGTFFGPEEIAERARSGERFVEVFRGVRGMRMVPVYDGTRTGYTVVSSRGVVSLSTGGRYSASPCTPQIYLDGFRYTVWDGFEMERLIALDHVAAIEAYPGPAVPHQYLGQSPCGVILVWTH